jgi:hypothetical protein
VDVREYLLAEAELQLQYDLMEAERVGPTRVGWAHFVERV